MERLTISDYGKFKIPPPAGTKEKEQPSYMDLYQRLAAIEDILGDKYDLDRLRELVQADRERRRVVTPPDPATESEYEIICRPLNPEYIHLEKVFCADADSANLATVENEERP